MKPKVVLGLSGGVDSAVAACLLQEAGYEVYGHWLDIGLGGREEAQSVADKIGIPFSAGDIRRELEEKVCAPFAQAYREGQTPIPCARCNPAVKFPALFQRAREVGANWVATGHYARIIPDASGEPRLYRGLSGNDQAYMLARLPVARLSHILFPLGELEKPMVREKARTLGLTVAEKPDSMEICFIPDGDYAAWLDKRGGMPPAGDFVNGEGQVLGKHKGIHHYTIGQRRGLGISAAGRLFVSGIDPNTNRVRLSDGADLYASTVWCRELNPLAPFGDNEEVTVRLRHSKVESAATLCRLEQGRVRLDLHTPARAPTPGQLAVFYRGDLVLGSGWIEKEARCRA